MSIDRLRWFTRLLISVVELFLIGMIIWFLFFSSMDMDSEKTNLLSVIIGGSDAPLLALIVGALGLFIWKNEQSARADRTKLSDRLFEVIKESQVGMDNVTTELTAIKITNADTNARVAGLEREMEGIKERFMVMKV